MAKPIANPVVQEKRGRPLKATNKCVKKTRLKDLIYPSPELG